MTNSAVVFNNNRTMQKTYRFKGKNGYNMTEEEAAQYINGLNNIFKRFKTNWIFNFETQKRVVADYSLSLFQNRLQQNFEEERQKTLSKNSLYEQEYLLTIVYRQPSDAWNYLEDIIEKENREIIKEVKKFGKEILQTLNIKSTEEELEKNQTKMLDAIHEYEALFLESAEDIMLALKRYFSDIEPLSKSETLTYLHSIISDSYHPIKSDITSYITQNLSDSTFLTGRMPKLGSKYMGIIGIKDLPNTIQPFIFDRLNNITAEYRFCIRYIALSKEDAVKEVKVLQKQHEQRAKPFLSLLFEEIRQKETTNLDEEALMDRDDATTAYEELVTDNIGLGYYTMNLVLLHENAEKLKEELADIKTIINDSGFVATIEKDNSTEAWLSTIPSCYQYNIRKYLVNSANLACASPVSTLYEGEKKNNHFSKLDIISTPLLRCQTPEKLPFYLNLHDGDVGHTTIIGSTGTGKSVLLNTIASNFKKYPGSKIFFFDKSASSRILTQAIGGNFYNLLVDEKSIAFQPLIKVDSPIERTWVLEWICDFLESKNLQLRPSDRNEILEALKSVANSKPDLRTMTTLKTFIQHEEIREALQMLTIEGAYGKLYDSQEDKFGEGNWQVFEMEKLMENESIVASTLDYLFHRIEEQLTGVPALILLDECWLFLRNPKFRKKIVEYLKDMRKKNCCVVLATQNLSDIDDELLPIIVENTTTKIYLANGTMNENTVKTYEKFGLNLREISIIKNLIPKKEYFYRSSKGGRVFDLTLSPLECAFYTATSKKDQGRAEELKHLSTDEFIKQWRKEKAV